MSKNKLSMLEGTASMQKVSLCVDKTVDQISIGRLTAPLRLTVFQDFPNIGTSPDSTVNAKKSHGCLQERETVKCE